MTTEISGDSVLLKPERLRAAARSEGGVSRRLVMAYGAALATIPLRGLRANAQPAPSFRNNPFSLGVASGDPAATSVVLWTRLAPEPLEPFGGMPPGAVRVRWEVAGDDQMRQVVASGTQLATPQLGHSVHVEVEGLEPDRWYWYRFRVGDADSPIGRTRTFPRPHAQPEQLRFAFTSCQNYEQGYYTAYRQMAEDNPDLVIHLGDYIYEYAGRDDRVRKHMGGETHTLEDYRQRISQYRADPLLHGMHALCPWLVTWDDHEVDNNYADLISEEPDVDPLDFMIRRASAYQAYYEMMPLRARSLPRGHQMQLYRRVPFGRLAEFLVLDTRQYRSDQPNDDRRSPLNEAATNPSNTMLGEDQRDWLYRSLLRSRGQWNVLAQQVMMGLVDRGSRDDAPGYSMDQWPGYAAERAQIFRFIRERRVPNPVVLTGDIHSNWVNDLRVDDRQPETDVVGTEFVCTSLSSGGDGTARPSGLERVLSINPGVKHHDALRGYVRCTVDRKQWRSDYMAVDRVTVPDGEVYLHKSFVVENGQPGAQAV